MTKALNSRLHALLTAHCLVGYKKEAVIHGATNGRTSSAKELTDAEALRLIDSLPNLFNTTAKAATEADSEYEAANNKRRKLCGLARNIGWVVWCDRKGAYKADMPRLYNWVLQYGYQNPKPLNDYTAKELNKLITQFKEVHQKLLQK